MLLRAVAIAALLLCACPTSRKVTRIYAGMPYEQLLDKVGQPQMRTVEDSATVTYYYTDWQRTEGGAQPSQYYCVTVRSGQVVRFGPCPSGK